MKHKYNFTEFEHDSGKIVCIDQFLEKSEVNEMADFFEHAPYRRNEFDTLKTAEIRQWVYHLDKKEVAAFDTGSVRKTVTDHFGYKKISLDRAYCNAISYGDVCFTHIDRKKETPSISVLFFANKNWKKDWGGEILFFNKNDDAIFAITPKPGRIVLFHGHLKHRAGIPQRNCHESRKTFLIKYFVN